MNKNSLATLLAVILAVCAVFTAWASVRYFFSLRQWQKLQAQALAISNTRNAVQALANETLQYSTNHPAINSLLEQFEIKNKPSNAPAAAVPKPAAK